MRLAFIIETACLVALVAAVAVGMLQRARHTDWRWA